MAGLSREFIIETIKDELNVKEVIIVESEGYHG